MQQGTHAKTMWLIERDVDATQNTAADAVQCAQLRTKSKLTNYL